MARNEEKHAGRLNRLWLQKLDEEQEKKNPTRPGLGSLNSASDVKKWIPSIKKDIDFYLKQSQVTCYPDRQIKEFSSKIESLTKEYKAYVRKLKDLQPLGEAVPWTDRVYTRKHKVRSTDTEGNAEVTYENYNTEVSKKSRVEFSLLSTPLLAKDNDYSQLYGYGNDPVTSNTIDRQEKKEFIQNSQGEISTVPRLYDTDEYDKSNRFNTDKPPVIISVNCEVSQNQPLKFDWRDTNGKVKKNSSTGDSEIVTSGIADQKCNTLNLPYSDSSDEDG